MLRYLFLLGRRLPFPLSLVFGIGARSPIIFFLICLSGSGWYYAESAQRDSMSWQGVPEATHALSPTTLVRVLRNQDFLVGWSDVRMTPLWVEYRLSNSHPLYHLKRLEGFSQDWRSGLPLTSRLYDDSGFDRGHMAPNYAISSVYGVVGQHDTFKMTNVAPQRPNLNRKLWQRLESAVMDHMLPQMKTLWVITGPIYSGKPKWLPSCQKSMYHLTAIPVCVSIPAAFYKIIIAPDNGRGSPAIIAFIMPQNVRGDEPLNEYLVPVSEIEKRTGLTFFPNLAASLSSRLKDEIHPDEWRLSSYSRLPSRY